ncbi:MAG TPA: cupin domain-containing protein [Phycisphaerae bacterium]|nr:cupin domain-containing protein [Phycisphaerae bacterium]
MEHVREQDQAYRGGASGVKYLFRGPCIDWGVILFAPGEQLGRHVHHEVEETFYFVEGEGGRFIVDDGEHPISVGAAFRIEPGEVHNIINDTQAPLKAVFIKSAYRPKDKVDV